MVKLITLAILIIMTAVIAAITIHLIKESIELYKNNSYECNYCHKKKHKYNIFGRKRKYMTEHGNLPYSWINSTYTCPKCSKLIYSKCPRCNELNRLEKPGRAIKCKQCNYGYVG